MTGARSPRRKGDSIERELVAMHRALGVHAERYPLTGPAASVAAATTWTSTRSATTRRRS
jgi:hypothetical protein